MAISQDQSGAQRILTCMDKPPLYDHQKKEIAERTQVKAWALLWEQGTAKTRPVIEQAAQLFREGKINTFIIITDNGIHSNWARDELPMWMPADVPYKIAEYHSSKASTKIHKNMIASVAAYKKGLPILCTTWEACNTKLGKRAVWDMLNPEFGRKCFLVADESIALKTPDAERTETVLKIAEFAAYRRILNGTPVDRSPTDIYSQIQFLDRSFWARDPEVDCSSFTAFKAKFVKIEKVPFRFTRANEAMKSVTDRKPRAGVDFYEKEVEYTNLDVLHRALMRISSRVTKDEVLKDLPPKVYAWARHELTDEQERVYAQLENMSMADIGEDLMTCATCDGEGTIGDEECPACYGSGSIRADIMTAPMAVIKRLRQQQVLCGYQKADNEPVEDIPGRNLRMELLQRNIENRSGPFIIFGRWQRDMDKISAMLKKMEIKHGVYDGRTKPDEKTRIKQAFQAGELEGFVGNPAACSKGITLTAAQSVHYWNSSHRFLHRQQSEDRAHRAGLKHSVTYYDYVVEGTEDMKILENLRRKLNLADAVTGDKPKDWLAAMDSNNAIF